MLGKKKKLVEVEKEYQRASVIGMDSAWYDSLLYKALTPDKLVQIVEDLRSGGDSSEYLSLVSELEAVLDGHYRTVLQTRKLSVTRLPRSLQVDVAKGGAEKIAEALREDVLEHDSLEDLMLDLLDALSKGYSVVEILWGVRDGRYIPKRFVWKDPRWFAYDREQSNVLGFKRDGQEIELLPAYKFIVHEPHLISGPPILGGLGLPVLFYAMLRRFCLVQWGRFCDRYGKPTFVGKYGRKATKEDIGTLKSAIRKLGIDAGAVMPESMLIEILESKSTGAMASLFRDLIKELNKEISKIGLGQTMSSEDGSSLSQAKIHDEVRKELRDADAIQLAQSLNAYLIKSYVELNFGSEAPSPKLVIGEPESEDNNALAEQLGKLVPLGLRVKAEQVRQRMGLETPGEDDEVLGLAGSTSQNLMLHAAEEPDDAYESISNELLEGISKAAQGAGSYEEFMEKLRALDWPAQQSSEQLGLALFQAFIDGLSDGSANNT